MSFFEIIRDTTANWTARNPTLLANQIGIESDIRNNVETDTGLSKLGNGIDAWSALSYWPPGITGDVQGPASSTDNAAAAFDSTTGKLVKDGSDVNLLMKRALESGTSTATAAGTTVLTVASNPIQIFTGSTTQTVTLPVVTTLIKIGFQFLIINDSSGALTINSSGANLVQTMAAGTTALLTCVALTGTAAASWDSAYIAPSGADANGNIAVAGGFIGGFATTPTAAGTTTLTVSSAQTQEFTGVTTQTVTLPVASTLTVGQTFKIINNSTGIVTVNSSGANLVQTVAPSTAAEIECVLASGTSAASWDSVWIPSNAAGYLRIPDGTSSASAVGWTDGTGLWRGGGGLPEMLVASTRINAWGLTMILADTTIQYSWGAINGGVGDTGLARVAATVIRASDGGAGYGWMMTAGNSRVAANVTTVSITPAAITGLSATLIAGRTYIGELVVLCAAATAIDGFRFDFDGGAATATDFRAMGTIADTVSVRPLAMTSALATDLVDATTTGDTMVTINFTITVNAGGTFIPRFAKESDAAGATNTIYRGSYLRLIDTV